MRNKIVSVIHNQFFCKNCKKATNIIYKVGGLTYCEDCVPEELKDLPAIDCNREPIEK